MDINILLFEDFEPLDVFGPSEMFSFVDEYTVHYFSFVGGIVTGKHGLEIVTKSVKEIDPTQILLIPGGMGTRTLVDNMAYINALTNLIAQCSYCLSVCTGSALTAKTGLLDGLYATSNKNAFEWVAGLSSEVNWVRSARWVVDQKFYTSSGVSAGMDMALGFIADTLGEDRAYDVANRVEYIWNREREVDPFAVEPENLQ